MFRRGMYLSLYTSKIGNFQLPKGLSNILQDPVAQQNLLKFIAAKKIDCLSFYNLNVILKDSLLSAMLCRFMEAARIFGIKQFYGIAATREDFDLIASYQMSRFHGKFTGLLTEIEFWAENAERDFPDFIDTLKYMKNLGLQVPIACYVGWFNRDSSKTEDEVAALIAQNADQVLVHCYLKDPVTAWAQSKNRIMQLKRANPKVEIYPIFSSEGMEFSAGNEHFMGEWLSKNSMTAAEAIFKKSFQPQGFQYFEYSFLKTYLKPAGHNLDSQTQAGEN